MSIENLIARLEGVRRTGADRWIARCPAHDDKSPSLSIREMDDGRILIRCFAECSAHEIVSAIGLELSDLFPAKEIHYARAIRRPFTADDALRCLVFEGVFLLIVSRDLATGKPLSEKERARLLVAVARIAEAERLCHA